MTQGQLQQRQQRINRVVSQLEKCGFEVKSTKVGRLRPVIEIERPMMMCQGVAITLTERNLRHQMHVSTLKGCLITWRA
ncbi:hypothetical protein [Photobacterium nomapromontoriensis]|uniref:hypothetical protein n=1 Tax=Photobacterium nomapromontoriensis TaxID=2910237 RepID=UPI003D14882F